MFRSAFANATLSLSPVLNHVIFLSSKCSSFSSVTSSFIRSFLFGMLYMLAKKFNTSLGVIAQWNWLPPATTLICLRTSGLGGCPSIVTFPSSGVSRLSIILISVVFPAPFGPSKPKTSPCFTSRLTFDSAFISVFFIMNVLLTLETVIGFIFVGDLWLFKLLLYIL